MHPFDKRNKKQEDNIKIMVCLKVMDIHIHEEDNFSILAPYFND